MNRNDKIGEIERLGDWSIGVLDYLLIHEPNSVSSNDAKQLIPKLLENGDLKGMRYVFGDLREFVGLLSTEDQVELDLFLRKKIGRGIYDEIRNKNKKTALILKRGKVLDDDEYGILLERVNDITKNSKKTETINQLLREFEQSRR